MCGEHAGDRALELGVVHGCQGLVVLEGPAAAASPAAPAAAATAVGAAAAAAVAARMDKLFGSSVEVGWERDTVFCVARARREFTTSQLRNST